MVTASALLEVDGLARSFGQTRALVSCRLRAVEGTIHSILGENGSGKSTLVKILAGVIAPDTGRVVVAGRAATRFSPAVAKANGVATVFQDLLNVPTRSVADNVLLGRPGWLRSAARRRQEIGLAREHLNKVGLDEVDLDAPLGACSLPVQQLVAIARALACSPRLLILDEATSALDVSSCEHLFALLRREIRRGLLVLFISHRMEEVVSLSDAVTVLANGLSVQSLSGSDISEERLLEVMAVAGATARG